MMSTVSPLASVVSRLTSLPLTRAPTQRWPTSVWTAYAKSTGVDPSGRAWMSPRGVKTKTSLLVRSNVSVSRNSRGSSVSFCHFDSSWTQDSSCELFGRVSPLGRSLYFQWAATPYSALRCISLDRIWNSIGRPPGPITVVWSDWYMLYFGSEM